MVADLFAVLLRLTLEMVERQVDGVLHRLVGLLDHLDVVVLADDEDLADVAVLLHLQDAADVDDVVEQTVLHLGDLGLEELADVGSDFEVAAGNFRSHVHLWSSGRELENLLAIGR